MCQRSIIVSYDAPHDLVIHSLVISTTSILVYDNLLSESMRFFPFIIFYVINYSSFCGYSALRMALKLKEGSHIFSLDVDNEFLQIANELLSYAGLASRVTFLRGTLKENLSKIQGSGMS